jgi:hypothetical protein
VVRNRAQCAQCRQIIESTHTHDFRACGCGSIFVDGGTDYIRYGERQSGDYIALWEFDDAPLKTAQDYIDASA